MKILTATFNLVAGIIKALGRLIATEPTLISSAIRLWLLFAIGRKILDFTGDDLLLFMAAVEGTLVVIQRALVTPTTTATAQADAAAETARNATLADVASLKPKPAQRARKTTKSA